jgi:tRNA-modifying protein YgfZ
MTENSIALLPDRGIVEVEGSDAVDFLQSLLTNDVDEAAPGSAIFAGLLTPQGKIQLDFLIYAAAAERYLLDCPKASAAELTKRMTLYKLRAKVTVADRSAEMAVAVGDSEAAASAMASFADPRHAALPRRHFVPAASAAALPDGADAYHAARIALCVPEGGLDYFYGEAFPHEVCYDLLHGVDFEKGCYVGQEVVSRMHHRGVAKTRIAGVRASGQLPPAGTEITGGEYPVGTMGSSWDGLGIGLIRLDRAEEAARHGIPLRAGETVVTLRRPDWVNYEIPAASGPVA